MHTVHSAEFDEISLSFLQKLLKCNSLIELDSILYYIIEFLLRPDPKKKDCCVILSDFVVLLASRDILFVPIGGSARTSPKVSLLLI